MVSEDDIQGSSENDENAMNALMNMGGIEVTKKEHPNFVFHYTECPSNAIGYDVARWLG